MELKDKTDAVISEGSKGRVLQGENIPALKEDLPLGGLVQSAEDMKESAFAGPGGAYYSQHLTFSYGHIDLTEDDEFSCRCFEGFVDISGFYQIFHGSK